MATKTGFYSSQSAGSSPSKTGSVRGITDDRGRSPRSLSGGSAMARKSDGKSGAGAAKATKVKNY